MRHKNNYKVVKREILELVGLIPPETDFNRRAREYALQASPINTNERIRQKRSQEQRNQRGKVET